MWNVRLIIFLFVALFAACNNTSEVETVSEEIAAKSEPVPEPTMEFGLPLDSFLVHQGEIARNQFLADILLPHRVTYPEIERVVQNAADVFDVRRINAGKRYTILCSPDSTEKACYFIYQPDLVNYVVYELQDSMRVYRGAKPVESVQKTVEATINSSLYVALDN